MIKRQGPNYGWYILALTGLTYAIVAGVNRLCMPVLFKEISVDLNLTATNIGTIWGMDPLAGVFVGLPAGLLADRFGIKKTLTVLCILAGIFGAVRGFSSSFLTLSATMFLFGLMSAAAPAIIPKVTAEWFNDKRLAFANALLNVMWSVGSMAATIWTATFFSPLLGGWQNVMFLYGAPAVLLGFLWLFTARDRNRPVSATEPATIKVPFKEAFLQVIRIKEVWLIGIITLTNWGASMGLFGYMPYYLESIGWSKSAAGNTITVFSGLMLLGSIPMALLSDKLKTRKGVLIISIAALAFCLFSIPYASDTQIWVIIVICAFLRSGASSLFNVMIFETKGVGSKYGGTAIGLASTVSMIGAFLAPPIGNSLERFGPAMPFIFWGVLSVIGIPMMFLINTHKNQTPTLR
jgi:NNP family nitrate/nitrite transporter-like MFS transporter